MNITEALLYALRDHGATEVYGIPGDFALPYFAVIEESEILPLYTLSHEPAVGFAADASARFSGGLGVAAVTYGAGALNMVNAVAQAYAEKSPVVVISGAPGTEEGQKGLLLHHQAKQLDSQFRMFQEITCDQCVLDDPKTAPECIARVLRSCVENSRPVYIEIPRDMASVPCEEVNLGTPSDVDPEAVAACAESMLERLQDAVMPIMMVGVEVRRYGLEEKVAVLSERLGIPVATSFMGIGLLAGASNLEGSYLGVAGDEALTSAVESSDALLLMGVIMSDTNFGTSARHIDTRRAMHVENRSVRMGYYSYQNIPMADLVDEMLRQIDRPVATVMDEVAQEEKPYGFEADDKPVVPVDVATLLNDHFKAHGAMPLATDIGDCMFTAFSIADAPLVAPGYYASMGFGVPAGMGVQLSTGERSLTLVGDGAFQMTGMELGNCSRLGINPIVLLLNNASWEMLHLFQPQAKYNDLGRWNFAGMAEAMGGKGRLVTTRAELQKAFEAALADESCFQLLDIQIPAHEISPHLAKFVDGVKRLH